MEPKDYDTCLLFTFLISYILLIDEYSNEKEFERKLCSVRGNFLASGMDNIVS